MGESVSFPVAGICRFLCNQFLSTYCAPGPGPCPGSAELRKTFCSP